MQHRGADEETVDLAGAQRLDLLGLAVWIGVGVHDDGAEPLLANRVVDPADDRREHRVRQIGHDHTQQVRPARLQATCVRIRNVPQSSCRLPNSGHGLCADFRGIVQRPGNGPRMDAGSVRDIAQCSDHPDMLPQTIHSEARRTYK